MVTENEKSAIRKIAEALDFTQFTFDDLLAVIRNRGIDIDEDGLYELTGEIEEISDFIDPRGY